MPRWVRAWLRFLKGLQRKPEDSATFRGWVAANVAVGLLALASQLEWPDFFLPCLALTGIGMFLSHRLRSRNNWEIKAALSILMMLALGNFFLGLSHSLADPREPLAQLLMWLQALHSCDLPTRRDLSYSLLVALILISMAAVLSLSYTYAFYLLAYFATAIGALRCNVRSLILERTGWLPHPRPSSGAPMLSTLALAGPILAWGLLVIVLMPKLEGFRIRALPVSWQQRLQKTVSKGEVQNPFYPGQMNKDALRRSRAFNPDGYAGFNPLVDLQTRGKLNHVRVFQVRTSTLCYYRGMTFDTYDGQFWTQSPEDLRTLNIAEPPFTFAPVAHNSIDVVQVFYVDRPLANLVFFSPEASQVYFPSQLLYLDRSGCLRAPFTLDQDTVYSVVSRQARMTAEELSRLPRRDPELRKMGPYLALPDKLPPRVPQLAREVVGRRRGYFERAMALCSYLQNNYTYNLDIPRFPEDQDCVDHFLFEARQGYCEHFASALAVLCRSQGIPARYCTGFLPGEYNPFTGFREVYGDQAHAWVEVYVPGYGWMTLDPTPGGPATPELQTEEKAENRWLGLAILKYLQSHVDPQVALALTRIGLALAALLLLRAGWKALTRRTPPEQLGEILGRAFVELGETRHHLSPRQRLQQGTWGQALAPLEQLVKLHEQGAYAGPPRSEQLEQARALLVQIRKIREQR